VRAQDGGGVGGQGGQPLRDAGRQCGHCGYRGLLRFPQEAVTWPISAAGRQWW
jgi:hypothetical protein